MTRQPTSTLLELQHYFDSKKKPITRVAKNRALRRSANKLFRLKRTVPLPFKR